MKKELNLRRAGLPWSAGEEDALKFFSSKKLEIKFISRALGRSIGATESRLGKIGNYFYEATNDFDENLIGEEVGKAIICLYENNLGHLAEVVFSLGFTPKNKEGKVVIEPAPERVSKTLRLTRKGTGLLYVNDIPLHQASSDQMISRLTSKLLGRADRLKHKSNHMFTCSDYFTLERDGTSKRFQTEPFSIELTPLDQISRVFIERIRQVKSWLDSFGRSSEETITIELGGIL